LLANLKYLLLPIGPSRVRAPPLAAGINEGGHYFKYFGPSKVCATSGATLGRPLFLVNLSLLVLTTVVKTTEGCVIGFQNCAWAPRPGSKDSHRRQQKFSLFSSLLVLPPLLKSQKRLS
jgi:hypothetical protein